MKTNRRNAVTFIISIVGLVSTLITARATLGQTRTAILQGQVVQATVLKLRSVRPKPLHTTITPKVRADVLVVKFREGTRVRERLGLLEADLTNISPAEEQLRSEEHTSELQSRLHLVCRLLLEKKKIR